jgi:serine/threonine protein kinase
MSDENRTKLQAILGDKYDVQDMIYRGGMGEIYLGRHKKLGAKVAIKIMIQKLTDDPELKKRFHREAQLYASLRHPNIIHIYDFGTDDAFDYMVFPFIDGETLQQTLKRVGRLDAKECLHIIISVAKALAYANENNVIHRDVKPSNIMIEKNGNVLIADFGISKDLKDIELTLPGTVLGSPKYISPEQVLGKDADSRSDQYALGLIFFEMITGSYPFQGTQPSALFYSHVNETPKIPDDIAPMIPRELVDIIFKLIAKDPSARFDKFNGLIEVLTLIQMEETQIHRKDGHPYGRSATKNKQGFYLKSAMIVAGISILLVMEYFWIDMRHTPKTVPPPPETAQKTPKLPMPDTPQTAVLPAQIPQQPEVTGVTASAESPDKPLKPLPAAPLTVAEIKKLLLNFGEPDESGLFQISTNQQEYKIGDTISYTVKATKDCHIILLDFATTDEMVLLFPNQFHPDTRIDAGVLYHIPVQGSFDVTGPAGSETVAGFAADTAFDLLSPSFDQGPFMLVTNDNPAVLERIHRQMEKFKSRQFFRKTIDFHIITNKNSDLRKEVER